MLAYLRSEGKCFSSTEVLKSWVSGDLSTLTESLMTIGGIASGPADLFELSSKISFSISFSSALLKLNVSIGLTNTFILRILGCLL